MHVNVLWSLQNHIQTAMIIFTSDLCRVWVPIPSPQLLANQFDGTARSEANQKCQFQKFLPSSTTIQFCGFQHWCCKEKCLIAAIMAFMHVGILGARVIVQTLAVVKADDVAIKHVPQLIILAEIACGMTMTLPFRLELGIRQYSAQRLRPQTSRKKKIGSDKI